MTPTEISNLALSQLPAGAITSLDESSLQARECKRWYQQVLAELLQKAHWRFARKVATPALIDITDRPGRWAYSYAMPADLALVLGVYDDSVSLLTPYDFIGSTIYSNVIAAKIEYISTADFNALHTALFRSALIASLAVPICMPIIKSSKRQKELAEAAEIAVQRAQEANQNENKLTYMNHMPDVLAERMGMTGLEGIVFPGPEVNYPDFDPVGTFESELDT